MELHIVTKEMLIVYCLTLQHLYTGQSICMCNAEILCDGDKRIIVVGLVPKDYPEERQPGWCPQSIAYHADNGG